MCGAERTGVEMCGAERTGEMCGAEVEMCDGVERLRTHLSGITESLSEKYHIIMQHRTSTIIMVKKRFRYYFSK